MFAQFSANKWPKKRKRRKNDKLFEELTFEFILEVDAIATQQQHHAISTRHKI